MKKIASFLAAAAVWVFTSAIPASAITIDFSTVTTGTSDPTIGAVSFFAGAGDPANNVFNDTFVDDYWTPGNNYLLSGKNDGTNPIGVNHWQTDFIGATLNLSGYRFNEVSFDIAAELVLPGNKNNILYGFINSAGGGLVGSAFFDWTIGNDYANSMSLTIANTGNYDYFAIFSYNYFGLDNCEPGAFHIDNFTYSTKLIDGNPVVPEPSTFALLGLGLAGFAVWRRRSSNR